MHKKMSLMSAVIAACFAAVTGAFADVTVYSTNFVFSGNWPENQPVAVGSTVPDTPPNIAAATASSTPFAIGEYGGPHTIAHLNDGLYGNAYSWITRDLSLSRNVDLGGTNGTVNMSFAGVALSNATSRSIKAIVFGRSAANDEYQDRFIGNIYIQITTAGSVSEITNLDPAADAQWTTMGYFTTTDPLAHRFIFNSPVQATGVRIVTAAGNCIDELVVHSVQEVTQTWGGGTVGSTRFSYSDDWPNNQPLAPGTAVPAAPPNVAAAAAGATPFAIAELGDPHTIAHLNDGLYGNAYSWITGNGGSTVRTVALGGYYSDVVMSYAGVALSSSHDISDIVFGRSAANEYQDRFEGSMYIQVTTAARVSAITSADPAADAQWTTLGFVTTTNPYEHRFTFSPAVRATGVRIVTAGGNCIDEIAVHGVPEFTQTWADGGVASDTFMYAGDWPAEQPVAAGSSVPSTPPDLAAASAGGTAFAISELGEVWSEGVLLNTHTIAHLNDGLYGNAYSWISQENTPAGSRLVDLGGAYGSAALSFAGVALPGARLHLLSDIVFGRSAANEYQDRFEGNMYIQVTTNRSVSAITSTDPSADAQWTTLGYLRTTSALQHRFTFPVKVQATGVRIVTAAGNCIDEIVVHGVELYRGTLIRIQ